MKRKIVGIMAGILTASLLIGTAFSGVAAEPSLEAEDVASESTISVSDEEGENDQMEETEAPEEEIVSEETEEEFSVTVEETDEEQAMGLDAIQGMKVLLENTLDADLVSVEVSNLSNEAYSGNLLSEKVGLKAGESCRIGIPWEIVDDTLGMYNIRLKKADGSVLEVPFVPLLENVQGMIYSENGDVLIHIRDERLEADDDQISESEMIQQEAAFSQAMADALVAEIK